MNIQDTLEERGKSYGDYTDHASVTQQLKAVMHSSPNWQAGRLFPDQMETLEMIAHKIGRILCGDPNHHDGWWDMAGYSTLSADRVLARIKPTSPSYDMETLEAELIARKYAPDDGND